MRLQDLMRDRRVLVTGGAGFIGSHLVEVLSERNKVFVYDDLSTGRLSNLDDLDAELVVGSLSDLDLLQRTCKGMDYVFHLAAIPSVPRSIDDPAGSNIANQNGTLNALIAARDCHVTRLVYSSSSSVYGDTPTLPKHEDMMPDPLSPYAVSKLAGEYYCKVFTRVYRLPTVSLRFFNVFGPRQDPRSQYAAVIPKFIAQAREGKRLTVTGDGTQTRDFTYVLDAVQGLIRAALTDKGDGQVLNVARGDRVELNRLAADILAAFGRVLDDGVEHIAPRPGDILHSQADIGRARALLGYEPQFTVRQGLDMTIGAL
ncbi:MAG: UDP-galactose-4-epimerase [Methanomassiliicoccales archaeon PtaU1.Bin124]|nr:MAG: UDP-galactose-4-epimerase [Methanomassiliicoccales archaeon PtaU1.Bin124]